jgi:hypothetical protein
MSTPSLSFVRESIGSAESDLNIARAAREHNDPLQALRVLRIVDDTLRTARAEMAAVMARDVTAQRSVRFVPSVR